MLPCFSEYTVIHTKDSFGSLNASLSIFASTLLFFMPTFTKHANCSRKIFKVLKYVNFCWLKVNKKYAKIAFPHVILEILVEYRAVSLFLSGIAPLIRCNQLDGDSLIGLVNRTAHVSDAKRPRWRRELWILQSLKSDHFAAIHLAAAISRELARHRPHATSSTTFLSFSPAPSSDLAGWRALCPLHNIPHKSASIISWIMHTLTP